MNAGDTGLGKKTPGIYSLGFVACVALTLIPFYAVIHNSWQKSTLIILIMLTAIIQFFVQVYCFLRLNNSSKQGRMNSAALMFTFVVLVIIVGGSMWIMSNLDYFMMH